MPEYFTPGVYVEVVPGGARPIQPARGASTAGFVGVAPLANAHLNEAVAINNLTQFTNEFAPSGANLQSTPLSLAVLGYFLNGGSRCYIVNVGRGNPIGGTGQTGVDLLKQIDDIGIVAAPGYTDPASYDAVLTHCELMGDRMAILEAPLDVEDINDLLEVGTLSTNPRPRRVTKGENSPKKEASEAGEGEEGGGVAPRKSNDGTLYFPWLRMQDPLASGNPVVDVPPSGHVAGIWARSDRDRGVHKAPANEVVRGIQGLTRRLTREEQAILNPAGINCIRFFSDKGITLWGARTHSDDPEWRYLNVRRLVKLIAESIEEGTRWVVFEPNDEDLWAAVKRDVSNFLMGFWRSGALMGRVPEQAFFVKCDEETNPPDVRDLGQLVCQIGVAPVKPAEFVIFRISQWAGGSEVTV